MFGCSPDLGAWMAGDAAEVRTLQVQVKGCTSPNAGRQQLSVSGHRNPNSCRRS